MSALLRVGVAFEVGQADPELVEKLVGSVLQQCAHYLACGEDLAGPALPQGVVVDVRLRLEEKQDRAGEDVAAELYERQLLDQMRKFLERVRVVRHQEPDHPTRLQEAP